MKILYGVVEWLEGDPILDGMLSYDTKDEALKIISKKQFLSSCYLIKFNVTYTIIRIYSAGKTDE